MEKIKKNPIYIVIAMLLLISVYIAMNDSVDNMSVDGNSSVDNSKKVTASNDSLDNGSIKIGNIGSINGDLDLSKKD